MKKIYVALLVTNLILASSFAQKGKNFIGVGADLSLPAVFSVTILEEALVLT